MRTLGESKVLSFLFLVLIKVMRSWVKSKISFSNPRSGKHHLRFLQEELCNMCLGVLVDDNASGGWFVFY